MIWKQSTGAMLCGACREPIQPGQPVMLLTLANLPRCQSCAKAGYDTAPPTDWPAITVPESMPSSIQSPEAAGIRRWAKKQDWFDARMAASGNDH